MIALRRPSAGAWAAALLVPPLALHLGCAARRDFWIGTTLTVLGFVPGAAYTLVRLGMPRRTADRKA